MLFILAKTDPCATATNIITVFQAIRWISQAWKQVREVKKCFFRKAGVLDLSFDVVTRDPFYDLDGVNESLEIDE